MESVRSESIGDESTGRCLGDLARGTTFGVDGDPTLGTGNTGVDCVSTRGIGDIIVAGWEDSIEYAPSESADVSIGSGLGDLYQGIAGVRGGSAGRTPGFFLNFPKSRVITPPLSFLLGATAQTVFWGAI
jgi:hypothetical protein